MQPTPTVEDDKQGQEGERPMSTHEKARHRAQPSQEQEQPSDSHKNAVRQCTTCQNYTLPIEPAAHEK